MGGFAIGTTEFAIMGLLPQAVEDLGVDLPAGGVLISAYALGVVVGAPLLAAGMARVDRRTSALWLMALFVVGHAISLWAPTYESMLVARFISGLPHGAYFSAAALAAAHLAGPARRGQAIAWVMAGLSVANLLGVPLATWLGQELGWRSMFVVTGVFGLATVLAVAVCVPTIPAPEGTSIRRELGGMASPALWKAVAVGIVGFAGMFALYTYIVPVMVEVGGMPLSLAPLVMGFYGVGMVVGTLLGGSWADRSAVRTLQWSLGLVAVSLAAFSLAAPWWWLSLIPLMAAAICASALVPSLQVLLVDSAPQSPQLAGALNHSALNLANAAGAWVGAAVIAGGATLQVPAAAGAVLAFLGLALSWILLRRTNRLSP
ncbi:MFS transporter, DHA1 family, arabinose polymer transporter [Micrococcus terreus]|uniref:MFS transporter, DHA1 family, arabinose polymer transporter n=2 Tax=Micrococcus terreus TaxID=574650 RepID=A0A1I7MF88_9MICC|nr:MFS transporter, DHA1 family, arabinose polymer transporter [Micrococcus terreus]